MIYVPMGGRIGNQLFYYAYARFLQESLAVKHELCFDFSSLIRHGNSYRYETEGWEDGLQYFNVHSYETYDKNRVTYREGDLEQKYIAFSIAVRRKLRNHMEAKESAAMNGDIYKLSSKGMFYFNAGKDGRDQTNYGKLDFLCRKEHIFVRGIAESSAYMKQIRNQLLDEITPKAELLKRNERLFQIINTTNSVCISIRRGDYVSNPEIKKKFYLCGKKYFYDAAAYIKRQIPNPVFIIFSDDIEWCRKELHFTGDVQYESPNNPIWEKLRLMYSCRHFIISNSTFSWWAQYLSRNEDKMVLSPDRWYADRTSSLIEDSFIKLPV